LTGVWPEAIDFLFLDDQSSSLFPPPPRGSAGGPPGSRSGIPAARARHRFSPLSPHPLKTGILPFLPSLQTAVNSLFTEIVRPRKRRPFFFLSSFSFRSLRFVLLPLLPSLPNSVAIFSHGHSTFSKKNRDGRIPSLVVLPFHRFFFAPPFPRVETSLSPLGLPIFPSEQSLFPLEGFSASPFFPCRNIRRGMVFIVFFFVSFGRFPAEENFFPLFPLINANFLIVFPFFT